MSKEYKDLIVGLDIGTAKITCMVAEVKPDGRIEVVGSAPSPQRPEEGRGGNIEATVDAISRVIQEVELMAECKIRDVYTGIAGSHIRSFNSNGMVAIKDKEVSTLDVERVIEVARAMPIPADQQILHILTQEFIIDGQDGVREPIGMSGVLEVKVHIVTGAVSAAQNVIKCVRRCGLEVMDLILQPLASSWRHALRGREGAGRVSRRYRRRHHRHRGVHPRRDPPYRGAAGGRRPDHQRHRDGAAHPTAEAEDIKIRHGVAMHTLADPPR